MPMALITQQNNKISSFRDLKAWQECHKLLLVTYSYISKFPKTEMYELASQLRRSSVSVTSNIAEGFGRRSKKEKIQFYHLANGSLLEVENQLVISHSLKYITDAEFEEVMEIKKYSQILLQGLIKGANSRWI